jgi:hypothetical protein
MKILWLDEHCTRAIVTRGWFRKRSAAVTREANDAAHVWRFASGREVYDSDWYLSRELERHRIRELHNRAEQRDWIDTGRIPTARLLKGRTQP